MFSFSKVVFAGILGTTGFGADYYTQATRVGADPVAFGADGYLSSVQERYLEWVHEQDRDKRALTEFLPDPTGAWQKSPWSRELESILAQGNIKTGLSPEAIEKMTAEDESIGGFFTADLMEGFSKKSRNTVIYFRLGEIIEITLRRNGSGGLNSGQEAAMQVALENISSMNDREIFARIRGVRFIESKGMGASFGGMMGTQNVGGGFDDTDTMRAITGTIGDSVKIAVRARARSGSIKTLLSRIDYDGVIAQLDTEVQGVGNSVVNSLPQIKDRDYKAIERKKLAKESEARSETAMDRFYALFGIKREEPEEKSGPVVINRGKFGS